MLLEDSIDDRIVNPDIVVHNDVPEARHIDETGQQVRRHDSMLRQHPENVGVILRISKPLSGDQAAADIQACLDRHLKAAFDRAFQASILDVCLERADFIPFAF
jgi:hypothetical protein